MYELVAHLAKQNEVIVCCTKLWYDERDNVMNVERHVRLFVSVQAASLALRAIALPDEATGVFPFLTLVERLALRRHAAFPVWV